jgi:hypothetical protein
MQLSEVANTLELLWDLGEGSVNAVAEGFAPLDSLNYSGKVS